MTFHTTIHEGAALETKAEGDVLDDGASDVGAVVAAALEGIRADVATRIAALETKAADTARLDRLEQRLSRPAVITNPADAPGAIERKALVSYLRHGEARMPVDEVKAMTVNVAPGGGYLAPPEFGTEMLKKLVQYSPIRQYARVVSISAPEVHYPRRVLSAVATWASETEQRAESAPTFEQVTLTPGELATFVEVSNVLLEDNAYDLEGELALEFAEQFGQAEGRAFTVGTGVRQPVGLFTASGIPFVTTGAANGFKAVNPADTLIDAFHAVSGQVAASGSWLMNRNTLGIVRKWKDAQGQYLLVDPISQNAPSTLLGRPIVECTDAPDILPDSFPIMFGDLSGYRIVDRVGLSFLRDPFSRSINGITRIHARKRVGGDVTNPDRFLKLKVAV